MAGLVAHTYNSSMGRLIMKDSFKSVANLVDIVSFKPVRATQ